MKKIMNTALFGITLTFSTASMATPFWTGYHKITLNSLTPNATTIVLDTDFHSCGLNDYGNIYEGTVGEDFIKTFNAVVITAVALDKTVSLKVDGCLNSLGANTTRGNITGIRLGD